MKYIIENWSWIAPILGLISTIIARYIPALPAEVNKLLSFVGGKQAVFELIDNANKIAELNTSVKRQAYVADELTQFINSKGVPVPSSQVNLLVEWCYKIYKDRIAK